MAEIVVVTKSLEPGAVVPASDLGTGTPDSTNYLRGDGAWMPVVAAGANTLYAPGSVTIADGNFWIQVKRLQLTTTQRLSVAGTGRYRGMN